ncbi:nuclear transport factor 2 family protein [Fodinibius sediminis]|uniref:SnoaL-like domain-containing protein n=1 Tax=Fodinibius sediminis TaxID=1214077 RepID=A0A521EKQ1_9BACT|nr:nuclear transport factor 2 family protein [Fodinibius sediminis]SMO84494.1 hypothetical protein SAMN06265218_11715 [Fodinibius sediminis]
MENPVEHQVKAFNNRNLDAFMEAFAADINVENGSGEELLSGQQEFRAFTK